LLYGVAKEGGVARRVTTRPGYSPAEGGPCLNA
jgi:hypothetical protein